MGPCDVRTSGICVRDHARAHQYEAASASDHQFESPVAIVGRRSAIPSWLDRARRDGRCLLLLSIDADFARRAKTNACVGENTRRIRRRGSLCTNNCSTGEKPIGQRVALRFSFGRRFNRQGLRNGDERRKRASRGLHGVLHGSRPPMGRTGSQSLGSSSGLQAVGFRVAGKRSSADPLALPYSPRQGHSVCCHRFRAVAPGPHTR